MDHTYTEIKSQYSALRKTFNYILSQKENLLRFYKDQAPRSLTYIGCGSSFYLCQSAEFSARLRLSLPATAMAAGDLMLNYEHYLKVLEGTLVITPTRSGSTSEVLMAIQNVRAVQNVPVLAITCVAGSALSKLADFTLKLPWAFDESVCQTRTVTNLYTANLLIIAILSGDERLIASIDAAIDGGTAYMERYESDLAQIAKENWREAVVLADGEIQGIAREGALAFTEIARVPGQYYHLLDVRHGPMVLIRDKTLVVMALNPGDLRFQKDLINDLLQKGATVIVYSDTPMPLIPGVSLQVALGANLDFAARGIPFILLLQMLSYSKAIQNGVDPDQPEGLDAWIKL